MLTIHGAEVEGTVKTTGKLGGIDSEGELLVEQVEGSVTIGATGLHKVDSRADVLAGDELEVQRVSSGSDTVSF